MGFNSGFKGLMITPFSLQIETRVLEELQFIASFYLHPEINVQVRVPIIMRLHLSCSTTKQIGH
jgi:hypothetical protein